jgi:hypothetical protein
VFDAPLCAEYRSRVAAWTSEEISRQEKWDRKMKNRNRRNARFMFLSKIFLSSK